jgi:multidrug resistance protein, MATE family
LLIGQDPEVAALSSTYIRVIWFGLFPELMYNILRKYTQAQKVALPSAICGVMAVVICVLSLSVLMFYFDMGFLAMPITSIITSVSSMTIMLIYIIGTGFYKPSWSPFTLQHLHGLGTWMRLAVPGALMTCSSWWAFEINIIVAGIVGPQPLAAMSVIFNVMVLIYSVPLSYCIAATTLVGNAVGAQDEASSRRIARTVLIVSILNQVIIAALLLLGSSQWPRIFVDDPVVVALIVGAAPLLCLFTLFDVTQSTLGGILRGAGKQTIAARAYLFSFYCVGIPLGVPLALWAPLDTVLSLWIGLTTASMLSMTLLLLYYRFMIKWDHVLLLSKERLQAADVNDLELGLGEELLPMETSEASGINDSSDLSNACSLDELELGLSEKLPPIERGELTASSTLKL